MDDVPVWVGEDAAVAMQGVTLRADGRPARHVVSAKRRAARGHRTRKPAHRGAAQPQRLGDDGVEDGRVPQLLAAVVRGQRVHLRTEARLDCRMASQLKKQECECGSGGIGTRSNIAARLGRKAFVGQPTANIRVGTRLVVFFTISIHRSDSMLVIQCVEFTEQGRFGLVRISGHGIPVALDRLNSVFSEAAFKFGNVLENSKG